MPPGAVTLRGGFTYDALHSHDGLRRLDDAFLAHLRAIDDKLHAQLLTYRAGDHGPDAGRRSTLLLACAPVLEAFIGELFGVEAYLEQARGVAREHACVFDFKKQFVQRRARRLLATDAVLEGFAQLDGWLSAVLAERGYGSADRELAVATFARDLLADPNVNAADIDRLTRWCAGALTTPAGKAGVDGWASFKLPRLADHGGLVPVVRLHDDPAERLHGPIDRYRRRDGFKLTDARMSVRAVHGQIHYCQLCHNHGGDFCSTGFPQKKGVPEAGFKVNPLGVTLAGCPLDEKISEMLALKMDGHTIAALATIMADNPMCPVTGHRVCNDCMKACVYQKQEPVDIPQIETRCLTDVLALPWGVEIYDLLARWNPLRARQWLPKPYNGLKVLVCGMGPAGFTLAHHLLMEGFAVVGIDGLKIEPLPPELTQRPVHDYTRLVEALDERVMAGFGGVAEYGITARWDKNFLKLIYLSLARRPYFQVYGGVRFGGTITVEEAWQLGFDHLAIAVGAGLPQALPIPGSLAVGMRQANDFLMALQLSGAARKNGLANLQVRLPAIVVGGGLTGIDTATEVQAYYLVQVEKTLERHEALLAAHGETHVRGRLDAPSAAILDELLGHGRAVRAERRRAEGAGEAPNFVPLLQRWGGVTVTYRRGLHDSPAYVRNHEELIKALEEGIYYAEGLDPKTAALDEHGHVAAMVFRKCARGTDGRWQITGAEVTLPARSVFVATGARPNVAYEFEHKGHFEKDQGHYRAYRDAAGALDPAGPAAHCKTDDFGAFTSYRQDDKRVSFIGDAHPLFRGSVVGAVASGMRTYPKIVAALGARVYQRGTEPEYHAFRRSMRALLETRIEAALRLTPRVVELTVRAPLAARRFQPGQFFRLQNFEAGVARVDGTPLQMEALALTGARVNRERGTVSLIVHENGTSARIAAMLKPGTRVALMGPTGVRASIREGETVMIVTEGYGVAHALAVGPALRAKGARVLHFALYDRARDAYLRDALEDGADAIVWITAHGAPLRPRRPQDHAATGAAVDVVRRYAAGALGARAIPLEAVQRLMIQASAPVVRAFKRARTGALARFFTEPLDTVASIGTPIQCGLKGVCAQCLQWQVDPATGARTKAVFGCSWQDQPLDLVDLDSLDARLGQNRLQEHLTARWLDHLLARRARRASAARRTSPGTRAVSRRRAPIRGGAP